MSQEQKRRMLGLFACILVAILLPPVLIGQPRNVMGQEGGDWLRNVIFDFQTLITGLLAIVAAYLTIKTTLEIDLRQQDRHQEIVALSVRYELRALERALHPQLDEINEIVENLWSTDYDPDTSTVSTWKWFSTLSFDYIAELRQLQSIIDRKQFTDGAPYFDGRLSRSHDVFRANLTRLIDLVREHLNELDRIEHGEQEVYYEFSWDDTDAYIVEFAMKFVTEANAFTRELARTKRDYERMKLRYRH